MAIDPGCKAKIEHEGNGVNTFFTFPFTIIEDSDLYVAVWDETTEEYVNVYNWTLNGGAVEFDTPPPNEQEFIIYRMTAVDSMQAIFSPGHPVKASDLNVNFEQLQNAIEDTRCYAEGISADSDSGDTIDLTEIEQKIEDNKQDINAIKYDITQINQELDDKIDVTDGITRSKQITGQWVSDDNNFAYTSALSERYDVIFLEDGQEAPTESAPYLHIQPGKFLVTSDNKLFTWNGDNWQAISGDGGNGGGGGDPTTIQTTSPLVSTFDPVNNHYNLAFDISSLGTAPTAARSARFNLPSF